jgi:hypothetical protein
MSPTEVIHAVARALCEDPNVIERIGFNLMEPTAFDPEPYDRDPMVIDWDANDDANRIVSICEVAV